MPEPTPWSVPAPRRRRLPRWKLALFGLVTVLLFFALLEAAMALLGVHPVAETEDPYVGFTGGMPLYVEERQQDDTVQMVTARNKLAYFNPQRFPAPKPHGTYRVFSLGESTTYGHPYDDRTSYSAWMREILPRADPSRAWEVVNAGGVSYASYRIANLMQELCKYQPDLFVVYVGQNEFLERRTYSGLIAANPSVNRLGALASRTRTYSAIRAAVQSVRSRRTTAARKAYRMTGEVDALLDAIGGLAAYTRDDTLASRIAAHYVFNLHRMVRIARAGGARILFVTPASNMKDCSPFKSESSAGLAADARERFAAALARGAAAQERGDLAAAATAFAAAVGLDPRYADAQYRLGQVQLALGEDSAAAASFQRAIDTDVCPLRQLSGMRAALRQVAQEERMPLVDFETILEDSTQARLGHRILGAEYFIDHVHPTVAGNRLLAVALVEAMAAQGIVHPVASWQDTAVHTAAGIVEGRIDRKLQALGLRNVARVFNWAGKTQEAGRLARQAAALAPEDADNLVVLGSQAAAEKRTDEAIACYERALAASPDLLEARNNLAAELARAGKYAEALLHYEKILETRPDQWQVHANAGNACLHLGRTDCALEHYGKVVALRPEDAAARVSLGRAYARSGRDREAEVEYHAALGLDAANAEANVEANVELGALLMQRGQLDSAVARFRAAARAAPDNAAVRLTLGSTFLQQAKLPEARSELQEALRLDPALPGAHNVLGLVQWQQGDIAAAVASFEAELRIDPDHPDAPANRAFIRAAQGQVAEAIRAYRDAIRARPDDAKILNGLAWLLATGPDARHRDGKEALALATRADSLTGHRHPAALNTLAAAYAECGRFDDAVRAADRAAEAARAAGQESAARDIERRRDRYYRAHEPYHERTR